MRILIVGDGHSAIHEVAVVDAFRKLGHQTQSFYWNRYFNSSSRIIRTLKRIQNKFLVGPTIGRLNQDLINQATQFRPKLIFIYRGTHITSKTINRLKQALPECKIFGYNNDDPFAKGHPLWLWRHFLKSAPLYDLVFAYRHRNINDFKRIGVKRVELLRSWFLPKLHKNLSNEIPLQYDCVFIGHYENDGRAECLETLISNKVTVRLYGPYRGLKKSGWDFPISNSKLLQGLLPVNYLTGEEYVKALCSAPIALCFLSKLNQDTYTRRCFEIPAVGSALFSEYSEDLASLFDDGKEAVFFKDKEDLIQKIKYYLSHPRKLNEIRKFGHERVMRDGHDIYSRLKYVIKFVCDT